MGEGAVLTGEMALKHRSRGLMPGNGQVPRVEAGEIWIVEQIPAAPFSLDPAVLANANVLLYERTLAPLVGHMLPVSAYAEPLPTDLVTTSATISPRALQFALDGWNVVQLVEACPSFRDRLQIALKELVEEPRFHNLPARLVTRAAVDWYRQWETSLRNLPDLIAGVDEAELLIVVLRPSGVGFPARLCAFNGLAG
jgi:hypothetical protein